MIEQAVTLDEAFFKIVMDEAKGKASLDIAAWLRLPDMVDSWRIALATMNKDLEAQLSLNHANRLSEKQDYVAAGDSYKTAWFQREADIKARKAKIVRVKVSVEKRLMEADHLIKQRKKSSDLPTVGQLEYKIAQLENELAMAKELKAKKLELHMARADRLTKERNYYHSALSKVMKSLRKDNVDIPLLLVNIENYLSYKLDIEQEQAGAGGGD